MKLLLIKIISSIILLTSTSAFACSISARVSIVGNEFPAIQTVGSGAKECNVSKVSANLTADHQKINVAGMSSDPAEYT